MTYLEKKAISRHVLKALRQGKLTPEGVAKAYGVPTSTVRDALQKGPEISTITVTPNFVSQRYPRDDARRVIREIFFSSPNTKEDPKFLLRVLKNEYKPELATLAVLGGGGAAISPPSIFRSPTHRAVARYIEKKHGLESPVAVHLGKYSGIPSIIFKRLLRNPEEFGRYVLTGGKGITNIAGIRKRLKDMVEEAQKQVHPTLSGIIRAHELGEVEAVRGLISGKLKKIVPVRRHADVLALLREANEAARLAPYGSMEPFGTFLKTSRGLDEQEVVRLWKQFGGGPGRPLTEEQLQRVAERLRGKIKPKSALSKVMVQKHEDVRPWGSTATERLLEKAFNVIYRR